ncbi:MAG TPA: SRPBCC family protein, partial [Gemmatimonadaceae bacterium]
RRSPIAAIVACAGVALAARGATNLSFARLTGVGAGRRAVTVQKSINIAAPIDEVFAWLTEWERWPEWMSHVREVRATGERGSRGERTHWVVDGPAGLAVEWDAETVRIEQPTLIAWKTVDGSLLAHTGTVRLVPTDQGFTRVDVQMSYNPIAGAVGHTVASLFSRDPKRQLDDDLARLKITIETGAPPHDAVRRPRTDVADQVSGP